jgi:hypothetical protein
VADRAERPERPERPVLTGLSALIGVGLVVGLVLGGVALAGVKVLGLDGDAAAGGDPSSQQSFYLPKPERTEVEDGPLITLAPDPRDSGTGSSTPSPTPSATPETEISLSSGQTMVTPMQQIDLTGTYPGGEGAILQVQRFADGRWLDFPVTASVSGETFTTYIQTGQLGVNRFRMLDTDTGLASNEVRVRIG